MKIYVGHSKEFDFKKELYEPLRKSALNQKHEITLPHEKSDEPFNSQEFLKNCDVMIAEISYPKTSLGIEIGWASANNVTILFVYIKGSKISNSLKIVSKYFLEYSNEKELINGVENLLKEVQ